MRIKLGDLREESKDLTKQIKAMTRRRDAIDVLISAFMDGKGSKVAQPIDAPKVPAPALSSIRPVPPPLKLKKAERRPTGKSIISVFQKAERNASFTEGQICSAIGYQRSGRDLALVRASLCLLKKSGNIKINPLGLYMRGDK